MWISHDLIRPFTQNYKANGNETPVSRKRTYLEISEFQATKLREKNNLNWMEFCRRTLPQGIENEDDLHYDPDYTSCARVDAIHFSRHGKSHVQVLKVTNDWGPQTKLKRLNPAGHALPASINTSAPPCACTRPRSWLPSRLEQRLHAIEAQLCLFEDSKPPANLFDRLRLIEDRLLYLEAVDPERYIPQGLEQSTSKNVCFLKASKAEVERRNKAYQEYYRRKRDWRKHVGFFGRPPLHDEEEMDEVVKSGYTSCARTTVINYVAPAQVRMGEDGGLPPRPDVCSLALENALTLSRPEIPLNEGSPIPAFIYRRIKAVEDRILELEAVSPEIFTHIKLIDQADGRRARSRTQY